MNFSAEHFGLAARDPVALKDWYMRVLDATLVLASDTIPPAFFIALPGGLLIEIYQSARSIPETVENTTSGWRHLALRVDTIETARDRLAARGVAFDQPIKPAGGGGRILFFQDAEGNLLHLVERPAKV